MSDKIKEGTNKYQGSSEWRRSQMIREVIEAATPMWAKTLEIAAAQDERRWAAIENLAANAPDVALALIKTEGTIAERSIKALRAMYVEYIGKMREGEAKTKAETSARRAEKAAYRAEAAATGKDPKFSARYAGKNGESDHDLDDTD